MRTLVKLAERLADFAFGDLIFFDQKRFDIADAFACFMNRCIELRLRNLVGRDKIIELRDGFFCDLSEIEERDAEAFRDFRDGLLIFLGKATLALLVEELDHPHQVFVFRHNGVGQHLLRSESRLFVPGAIVA